MPHVPDDADNRDPANSLIARPANSGANRILIAKILVRHALVDHTHRRRIRAIVGRQGPSAKEGNAEDMEIVAHDRARVELWFFTASDGRAAFDDEIVVE